MPQLLDMADAPAGAQGEQQAGGEATEGDEEEEQQDQQLAWSELDDLARCLYLLGFPRERLLECADRLRALCALNGGEPALLDDRVAPWLCRQLRQTDLSLRWMPGSPLGQVLHELASWQPPVAGALLLLAACCDDAELAELLVRCRAPVTCTNEFG